MVGFVPDLVMDFFNLLVDSVRISSVLMFLVFELLEFVFEFLDTFLEIFVNCVVAHWVPTELSIWLNWYLMVGVWRV